jgi:hypothetical protein
LVGGELLLADQFTRQLFAILRLLVRRQTVDQRSGLSGRQQAAGDKLMDELIDRDRHAGSPPRTPSRRTGCFRPKISRT